MPEPSAGGDRLFLQQAEEYRRKGQSEEALRVLEAALERNPGYVSARIARARCLLDLGRLREASAGLEQILERDATQLVARKLLIEGHLRQADPMRARRQLDTYTSLNPGDPDIDGLRSRIQDLLLADPVPLRTEVRVPPPKPLTELLGLAAEREAPSNGRHRLPEVDPFPEIAGRRPTHDYWLRLSSEGLFQLNLSAPASSPRAPEDETLVAVAVPHPIPPLVDALPELEVEEEIWPLDEPDTNEALDLNEETVAEPPSPVSEPARPVSATVTLGELYLSQGHYAEAERIFSSVLAEEPTNAAARVGLESVAALAQGAPASPEDAGEPQPTQRSSLEGKIRMLQHYLTALKGVGRNVS